jgi:TIR domain
LSEEVWPEMSVITEFWRRADFLFRGQHMFRLHTDGAVRNSNDSVDEKPCRFGWFINYQEGYKHAFIMTPNFGLEARALLKGNTLVDQLKTCHDGVGMTWGNMNPIMDDKESLEESVFTSKIYIFTDTLTRDRNSIRSMFKEHKMDAIIVDDERWAAQWEEAKPDAFICHDHRDQAEFADPLYAQLALMPLKIFYDKYSIRLGDDLVEKIEIGLAECRYAIILISKRLLENRAWASHEMRALINRQISEGSTKLILPIWIDVGSAEVRAVSPMLAKIAAARYSEGVEQLAKQIHRVVGA